MATSTWILMSCWFFIFVIVLLWGWLKYSEKRKEWEFRLQRLEYSRLLELIQKRLLGNVGLVVSEKLVVKEEWEDMVMILSFSEFITELYRAQFEKMVQEWVDRLSQELSDIEVRKVLWDWGNQMGQPLPKAVILLSRVGFVSIFFPYVPQLIVELNSLNPEISELTDVTLAKRTEYNDLLARILVQQSLSSR